MVAFLRLSTINKQAGGGRWEQVVAEDGGSPRRSGSVVVDVVVTDVNDNSPRFERELYSAEITENAAPQSNVVVVRSGDPPQTPRHCVHVYSQRLQKYTKSSRTQNVKKKPCRH